MTKKIQSKSSNIKATPTTSKSLTGRKSFLISALIIFFVQLIVFWPSFKLSLWGDDWLAFWRYSRILDIDPSFGYNQGFSHLTYFLTPYGPQDVNMGLLQKIFGYSPTPYYVASFLLRYLLSLATFFFSLRLTKKLLPSFFAAVFMAITTIGLDTTNWVFNMTSYLGLLFAVFFMYFYLKSFSNFNIKNIALTFVGLFFAIVIVPIRMHGYLPLILLTELYSLIISSTKRGDFKKSLVRILLMVVTTLVIKNIGTSFADPNESVSRIKNGMNVINQMITTESKEEVLLYPVTNFGNMLLPEKYWQSISRIVSEPLIGRARPFPVSSVFLFLIYLLVVYLTLRDSPSQIKKKATFYKFVLLGVFVNTLVWVFYKMSPETFASLSLFGSTLLGLYVLVFLVGTLLFGLTSKQNRLLVFVSIIWPFAFIALPWLTSPFSVFNIEHRYLIPSAIGITLMVLALGVTISNKKVFYAIATAFLLLHAFATWDYLTTQVERRGDEMSKIVWTELKKSLPETDGHLFYVVYFEGDSTNGHIIHNNAFFGFPPRRSLEEEIYDQYDVPVAITTYEELLGMVSDGSTFLAHAKRLEPVALDRIYAYRITGSNVDEVRIEDISQEVKAKLAQDLKNK